MSIQTYGVTDLLRVVDRAATLVGTYGHSRTTPERVSAMTRAELEAELIHQELESFIRYLYLRAPGGRFLHIYPSGRLCPRVYTPWRGKSTLTRRLRDALRTWLLVKADNRLRPPFLYSEDERAWYLDIKRYPDEAGALQWLNRHRMTAGELLNLLPYPKQ